MKTCNQDPSGLEWPQLLEIARSGSELAVHEVFARLSSYCQLVAGGRMEDGVQFKLGVSDIVQKSLLEAFDKFSQFKGSSAGEIQSWVNAIVHHNTLDAVRRFRDTQQRDCSREQSLDQALLHGNIASAVASPSFAIRRHEQDQQLQRALLQLPANQRAVVELRTREGFSYSQIAEALELSEVAARKLYSRAIDSLRKLLAVADE